MPNLCVPCIGVTHVGDSGIRLSGTRRRGRVDPYRKHVRANAERLSEAVPTQPRVLLLRALLCLPNARRHSDRR